MRIQDLLNPIEETESILFSPVLHPLVKKLCCHMCPSTFKRKQELQRHLKSIHKRKFLLYIL